ncbi:MAG: sulfite exporter TauE/SafE family protein [Proteobacteria bacterium]|nr:sulfite exporter TauE/SafE family protein [Pseudomonadota bacterium]MBU1738984.1 sulfite exporter TauE/SafE family protein [Pseudomonadota bacterium]
MEMFLVIAILGAFAGFMSGMLGIGGGIIMAPLLLYVPEWLGFPPLPMRDVAGLTIVQGLVACLSGAVTHNQFRFVSRSLTGWMGITIFITALTGGVAAGYVSNDILLTIFALLALSAAVLMFIPAGAESEEPDVAGFSFSRLKAVSAAGAVGLLGGLVGQGGSFLLIPLMTSFVEVPTRIAIGSNLAIVFLSSLAAFFGKALTGQIVWPLTLPIILTVIPAAHFGSLLSRKVQVARLRTLLAILIALAAIRIGISAVQSFP